LNFEVQGLGFGVNLGQELAECYHERSQDAVEARELGEQVELRV
jgi:hypothetical protein